MLIAHTRVELARHLADGDRVRTLVPTMGALHQGHLSLIAAARRWCDQQGGGDVVASIFVNPLQFGEASDLARYPRDTENDLRMLACAGCDVVWLPDVDVMYRAGEATLIEVSGPALGWEGAARPGHFRGVATVVAKLFGQIRPRAAFFGEKDWQQLQVVRRLSHDLELGVEIIGVPTLREPDGLAMSSRNRFLTQAERAIAPKLHAVLQNCVTLLGDGLDEQACLAASSAQLGGDGFAIDYLALVDGATLVQVAKTQADARLIAAARLGTVRLLDNVAAG